MSLSLGALCENSRRLYHMQAVAGREGMNGLVQWIHTLEDEEASKFLYGGELVFTTGIGYKGTDWLLGFAKSLKQHGASGLVLNLGPYLKKVPGELIDYCNSEKFPLFTVPWETRLVDITRDFCNQIIKSEKTEEDVGLTLKNLIFFPQESARYLPLLELHDFDRTASCCCIFVGFMTPKEGAEELNATLRFEIDRIFSRVPVWKGHFQNEKGYIYVLCGLSREQLMELTAELESINHARGDEQKLSFAVSSNRNDVTYLSVNYRRASVLLGLCRKQGKTLICYDDLDVQKIFLSLDTPEVLEEYAKDVLGKLISFDREHGTDYLEILRLYLECDGSVKKVADRMYVHRNTINYQLNKVKKILGADLGTFEERFRIAFAFKILDML